MSAYTVCVDVTETKHYAYSIEAKSWREAFNIAKDNATIENAKMMDDFDNLSPIVEVDFDVLKADGKDYSPLPFIEKSQEE